MVKAPKTGPRDNFAAPCAAGSGYRSLLLESAMNAIPVVILDVCSKQPLQMRLVDSNQMVQQFAAATADPTLGHAILPRTPYPRPHWSDAHGANRGGNFDAVLRIMIEEKEPDRRP